MYSSAMSKFWDFAGQVPALQTGFGEKAFMWFKAFFEDDDNEEMTSQDDDLSEVEKVPKKAVDYDEQFKAFLPKNTNFHDMLTVFSLSIGEQHERSCHLQELAREMAAEALQSRMIAEKFRESRKIDFLAVLDVMLSHLSQKVETLEADKDWLIAASVADQDTLRDELARIRGDNLRRVLKTFQAQYFDKVNQLGAEGFQQAILGGTESHHNPYYDFEAERQLMKEFWIQLHRVSNAVLLGNEKVKQMRESNIDLESNVTQQQRRFGELQQQLEVCMLRFVSENENLLGGTKCQLEVAELLTDIRHLAKEVDSLQRDIMSLKLSRNNVKCGVDILRCQDGDVGRAVAELGKLLQLLETLNKGHV